MNRIFQLKKLFIFLKTVTEFHCLKFTKYNVKIEHWISLITYTVKDTICISLTKHFNQIKKRDKILLFIKQNFKIYQYVTIIPKCGCPLRTSSASQRFRRTDSLLYSPSFCFLITTNNLIIY